MIRFLHGLFAGHELRRFGMLSPQTRVYIGSRTGQGYQFRSARLSFGTFNDVYVGFHLAGPTTGIWDWVIDGKYYLLGYYQNDFQVNATFSRELGGKTDLGLTGEP